MRPKSPEKAAAKAKGLARYFTGKPCRKGHIAERFVYTGACVECARGHDAAFHERNAAKRVAASTAWYRAHTEQAKATRRARDKAKPEQSRVSASTRRALKKAQCCTCCTKEDLLVFFDTKWLGDFDVDHRVPLALGGLHCIKNLQVLTPKQHARKTAIDMRLIAQVKKGKLSREAAVRYIESQ